MKKFTAVLLTLFFASHTAFATFLGDPTNIKGGGTGLSAIPAAGQILIGNAGSTAYALALMSGDATMAASGALTIANLAVTNAKIANSTIDLTAKVTGILPNANTTAASANTASAIVARDGSGNFIANTITAALTGTASGNLQATATNHGVLISGSGNTASVTAVGATNTILHGNTGADPSFSALVAADLPAPATSVISASAIDWSILKNVDGMYTKTLGANTTFTWSNLAAGQTVVIALTNTSSNWTVTWPAAAKWPNNTAPTQTVGAHTDVYTCKSYDGTNAYCQVVANY